MARLYADENFPHPVVAALRRVGHDVLTCRDAGHANLGIPDPDVLAFAISQGRAVLTLNRWHFRKLHADNPNHAGILACTKDDDFIGLAARIDEAIIHLPTLDSQLIRINRPPSK